MDEDCGRDGRSSRRAVLTAALGFPILAALLTLGGGLGIIPGWVQLDGPPAAAQEVPARFLEGAASAGPGPAAPTGGPPGPAVVRSETLRPLSGPAAPGSDAARPGPAAGTGDAGPVGSPSDDQAVSPPRPASPAGGTGGDDGPAVPDDIGGGDDDRGPTAPDDDSPADDRPVDDRPADNSAPDDGARNDVDDERSAGSGGDDSAGDDSGGDDSAGDDSGGDDSD